jgi:UDP-GlcNAc:undecaprenyl-phosphate/decaprenyl-phosphate GlcNAc-1-phosphate transferase
MFFNVSNTAYMYICILVAILITFLTGWVAIKIARRVNLIDIPGAASHKKHSHPTPLAGGMALAFSLFVLSLIFGIWRNHELGLLLIPTAIIFGMGLWDDARGMSAPIKALGQLVATLLLILLGIYIQFLQVPSFFLSGSQPIFHWMNIGLTVFWIIGVTNAYNLVDSMDGLSAGLGAWAFAFFMLATYDSQQHDLSLFCAAMLGICITLYYFNSTPARLFIGDSGAQTIGFLLAVVAILYTPVKTTAQSTSWFVPILLVGVPIFDTTLVFFSRIRRRKPFYTGNCDHTYHRLVAFGMHPNRAVQTMHMAALALDCLAFVAVAQNPFRANIILIGILVVGVVGLFLIDLKKWWP